MKTGLLHVVLLWSALAAGLTAAEACQIPSDFEVDRPTDFFDPDKYGHIALPYTNGVVRTIEANSCYDASEYKDDGNLKVYFNNSVGDEDDVRQRYVGFVVIKQYSYSMGGIPPILPSLFRNARRNSGAAFWISTENSGQVAIGDVLPGSDVVTLRGYDENVATSVTDFDALNALVSEVNDQFFTKWHALVGVPAESAAESAYEIVESTYRSMNRFAFGFDRIASMATAETVLVTYYLVKYSDSTEPRLEDYLELNMRGADCVHIKLVDSRGPAPLLSLGAGGRDFVTLQMDPSAACD